MCNPTDTGANVVVAAVLKNLPVQKHAFIGLQLPFIKQTILLEPPPSCQCCSLLLRLQSFRWRRAPTSQKDNQLWELAIPFMTFVVIKIFKTKPFPCLHTENTELYEECCACFFPMQKDSASFGNPLDLEQVDQLLQDIETASPPNPSAKSPASFLFATESFWYICQDSDPSLFQIMPDCELKAFQSESHRMQH